MRVLYQNKSQALKKALLYFLFFLMAHRGHFDFGLLEDGTSFSVDMNR